MCKCAPAYLLIRGQRCKERNDVTLNIIQLQNLGELAELRGSSTTHHRSVIRAKSAEVPVNNTTTTLNPEHNHTDQGDFETYIIK